MKNLKIFLVVLLILFTISQIGFFVYGCCTMQLYSLSVEQGTIEQVLVNDNNSISYNGYKLTNWTNEEIDLKKGGDAISEIKSVGCKKLGFFKSAVVCYLQTANNSVAQIKNTMVDDKRFSYPISKDVLQSHSDSALGCEIVEICTQYFVIVTQVTVLCVDVHLIMVSYP